MNGPVRKDSMPKVVLGLDQVDAAAAIGISLTKFKELVEDKELPRPRKIGRRKVWDLDELTKAFKAFPHEGEEDEDAGPDDGSWDDLRRR